MGGSFWQARDANGVSTGTTDTSSVLGALGREANSLGKTPNQTLQSRLGGQQQQPVAPPPMIPIPQQPYVPPPTAMQGAPGGGGAFYGGY